jgi:hypothetical protein
MVSFRRRRAVAPTGRAGIAAAAAPEQVRPRGEWAALPPVRTTSARTAGVVPHRDFRGALATTWSTPPALRPLAHDLSSAAPAGLIAAHVAPVPAYDGAPLRFAPAVGTEQAVEPFHWSLPARAADVAPAPDARDPEAVVETQRPSLLDRVLRRTPPVPAAAVAASREPARLGVPPSATGPRRQVTGAEDETVTPPVAAVPHLEPTVPRLPHVRPLDLLPAVVHERSGPAPAVESTTPAGPLRFAAAAEPPTAGTGPARWRDAPPAAGPLRSRRRGDGDGEPAVSDRRSARVVADEDVADGRLSLPAPFSDLDGEPAARRAATASTSGSDEPAAPQARPSIAAEEAGEDEVAALLSAPDHDDPDRERSSPARAAESTAPAGPLRFQPPDREAGDTVRPVPAAPAEEARPLVGQRPLGTHLLDAVRAAAPPRPVAGFVPVPLPDPAAPRDAVDRLIAAPSRPALRELGGRLPAYGGRGGTDESPRAAGASGESAPADLPDLPAGPGATESQPGLPDWWPDGSGNWSVRDVDPFQDAESPSAEPDDEIPPAATRTHPADGPALRQRPRPAADRAGDRPASRRVPFPARDDDAPALRQVRRPRAAEPEPATHALLDPHLPLPDTLPGLDLAVAARPDPPASEAPDPVTAPPAAAAPSAAAAPAGPSAEEVADHVRHALLVERERSGALADQW